MQISNVKDPKSQLLQAYQQTTKAQKDEVDKPAVGMPAPQERVDLSTQAIDIRQMKKTIADLPDIREDKVQSLKRQIEQGTYNVSGEKIAEKMVVESMLDILA